MKIISLIATLIVTICLSHLAQAISVDSARKRVAAACRQNPESSACRGSIAHCRKNPYDRFCARGGRTDCSLFPFLHECGGSGSEGSWDRPELICQRYPFSPVCRRGGGGFCAQNPGNIGCSGFEIFRQ